MKQISIEAYISKNKSLDFSDLLELHDYLLEVSMDACLLYAVDLELVRHYYKNGLWKNYKTLFDEVKEVTCEELLKLESFLQILVTLRSENRVDLNFDTLFACLEKSELNIVDFDLLTILILEMKRVENLILEDKDFKNLEMLILASIDIAPPDHISKLIEYYVELYYLSDIDIKCDEFIQAFMAVVQMSLPKRFYAEIFFTKGAFYDIAYKKGKGVQYKRKMIKSFLVSKEIYESISEYKRYQLIMKNVYISYNMLQEIDRALSIAVEALNQNMILKNDQESMEWFSEVMTLLRKETIDSTNLIEQALKLALDLTEYFGDKLKLSVVHEHLIEVSAIHKICHIELELRKKRVRNIEAYDFPFEELYKEYNRIDHLELVVNQQNKIAD